MTGHAIHTYMQLTHTQHRYTQKIEKSTNIAVQLASLYLIIEKYSIYLVVVVALHDFSTNHKFILELLISSIFTQKMLAGTVWLDPKWKVLNDDPDHLPPEYLQSPCRYLVSVQVSNSVLSVYKEPVIRDYPSHWLVTLSSIRFIIAKRCWQYLRSDILLF